MLHIAYNLIAEIETLEYNLNNAEYPTLEVMDSTHLVLAYEAGNSLSECCMMAMDAGTFDNLTKGNLLRHETSGTANQYHKSIKMSSTKFLLYIKMQPEFN